MARVSLIEEKDHPELAELIAHDPRRPWRQAAQHLQNAADFDERQIVELTVLIGTYNMHTRVLQALEIDAERQ